MHDFLSRLGIEELNCGAWAPGPRSTSGRRVESIDPATGKPIAAVALATLEDYEAVVSESRRAFVQWRQLPAPKRGEIVREMANAMRDHKEELGSLVTLEVGKILEEGKGEVQESIDIADFAVGLSRQLYGLSMHSERPGHRMYEQWHPIGPVGCITAFNFPNAVWAWNAMLAAICGDTVIWKPSLKAPLTAIATHRVCNAVLEKHGWGGVFTLIIGDDGDVGETMINDRRLPLISATGSTRMGRHVGQAVAKRLGRSLLELGGNNAIIVEPDADLDLALIGILFGAVGTAGQRCTSTRRVYLHEDVASDLTRRLVSAYGQVRIGNPLESGTLMGPLIDDDAVATYESAIATIRDQGGEVLCGGHRIDGSGSYVQPTIVQATEGMDIWRHETFAPILYLFTYTDIEDAIARQNDVDQGLSSAVFTGGFRAAETFLSAAGSDCGIANVNIGTSGAEIGGAFGGEKDTGGGRESGSDAWKSYMRRQTCTLNWSKELPLAQGVTFDL
ncbi:MAG TPA: aldehyde dehydrogenase family protein [Myxococcota bacterium]|nr:aldehyde dehydrogenase family protein [Myxococcota bacterium]